MTSGGTAIVETGVRGSTRSISVWLRDAAADAEERRLSARGRVLRALAEQIDSSVQSRVVIDPEDPAQVARLADAFCTARWSHIPGSDECDPLTRSSMKEALDSYLAERNPEEPTEVLHAVMYRNGVLGTLCDSTAYGSPVKATADAMHVTCPGCGEKLEGSRSSARQTPIEVVLVEGAST